MSQILTNTIRLVLTDLDDTVAVAGKHIVSEKVREAIVACEDRGIQVVPVTGRYLEMAQPLLEVLGFDGLGVFDNGATIRDCKTGEIKWSRWLEASQVKQVVEILVPFSRIIEYSPEHNTHVPADNEKERLSVLLAPTSHVYAVVPRKQLDQLTQRLQTVPNIGFYTAPDLEGDPDYIGIQVNHEGANKFHGVESLRKLLNIPREDTLAIGDGENDLFLFENARLKIAMGNATETLKARADHIVASVSEDGFAEAMQQFVLK